jgi:hypothetical protein
MKKFLALMAMLFVSVLAIWVAYRLAPETWAMIAGIVFGVVASLPMCGIVVLLLLRGNRREPERPVETTYYQAGPPRVILNAEPAPYASFAPYGPERGPVRRLPAGPAYQPAPARAAAPPRTFVDHAQPSYDYAPARDWAPEPEPWMGEDASEMDDTGGDAPPAPYAAWEDPAPHGSGRPRILGH